MSRPSIRLIELSFAFTDRTLFAGLSAELGPGWTGIAGANGAGKTTLLRLIAGDLSPRAGSASVLPHGALIVSCPQRVDEVSADVAGFAWAGDRLACRLRGRLRLGDHCSIDRFDTLSPGERKRWQIGAALWREPEVLLLDEPTNHLDTEAIVLLREELTAFRGAGVLVSHDRALLDGLCSRTLRLEEGGARLWPLPYSRAREAWEAEAARRALERERTQRKLRASLATLDAARRRHDGASTNKRASARMRDENDSDGRSVVAYGRAAKAEAAHARAQRRLDHRAERVRAELDDGPRSGRRERSLFLRWEPCPKPLVVACDELSVSREDRVLITGPNGAGKTTLLRHALAHLTIPRDRVLDLPQELTPGELRADLEAVRALPPAERGRVLELVDALGVDPDHLLSTAEPSPGEARKLRLAFGLGRDAWLLVLDEPTNHLDLPSIERLEAALVDYPGAILLVSHDERFAARVATTSRAVRSSSGRPLSCA